RLVAVRAPVPLNLARSHIDHGDAMIAVPIGHIGFVVRLVEEYFRDLVECKIVVAAGVGVREAELLDELALPTEHENVAIVGSVAADPEVAFTVWSDAVVRLRPLVALARTAPPFDDVALLIELAYRL